MLSTSSVTKFQLNWTANRKLKGSDKSKVLALRSDASTCPNTCEQKRLGTCYAMFGHEGMAWKKLTDGTAKNFGEGWLYLSDRLRELKPAPGTILRTNTAGDLPHIGGEVKGNVLDLMAGMFSLYGLNAYGYTHHRHSEHNLSVIHRLAVAGQWLINLSCQTAEHASLMTRRGFACVTVTSHDDTRTRWTDEHNVPFIVCPQQLDSTGSIGCSTCKLCTLPVKDQAPAGGKFRRCVVVFRSHGVRRKVFSDFLTKLH